MRVLAGFQPSGKFHVGNYFGSIRPNIDFQKESDASIFMVVDLHSLTTLKDPEELRACIVDNVLDFLAAGLDADHSLLFRQSEVPEHTELMWILSCVTPMGLLERAVSYKEKVEKGIAANVGLFTYPVLMAADILLYQGERVPVGKDQKQHVEIARDIGGKFNHLYGETFILPEPVIREDVAVVPGTDGQKMSKSYGNTIPLFGDEKIIKKAIMGIVTDSKGMNDPKDPDTCVIFNIHKLFLGKKETEALAAEYKNGLPYGDAKKRLLETYMDYFSAMRAARAKLTQKDVRDVLNVGSAKARVIAGAMMEKVKKAVGLL